ncbi:MAG: hypothetical protein JJE40_17300 [Vicinamibacteria bacterium]|nr:hypothetical protein [Vicinamibacteria bacterium]
MRMILAGAAVAAMTFGAATVGAQASKKFSGIKLVDMKARQPEQTVNVLLESSGLTIVDPVAKKPIKTFDYAGLDVTHTLTAAPPAAAGNPSAAATGAASMPMYMGKDPRNWLTIKSATDLAVLRVSEKVFKEFKDALGEHNVTIVEGK